MIGNLLTCAFPVVATLIYKKCVPNATEQSTGEMSYGFTVTALFLCFLTVIYGNF